MASEKFPGIGPEPEDNILTSLSVPCNLFGGFFDLMVNLDRISRRLLKICPSDNWTFENRLEIADKEKMFGEGLGTLMDCVPTDSFSLSLADHFKTFITLPHTEEEVSFTNEDFKHLKLFIENVQSVFLQLADKEKRVLRRVISRSQMKYVALDDTSFIMNWASLEALKYCIVNASIDSDSFTTELFSNQRRNIIHHVGRQLLLGFMRHIEKYIISAVDLSALELHETTPSYNTPRYNRDICSEMRKWLEEKCPNYGIINLNTGNPAESWRVANSILMDLFSDREKEGAFKSMLKLSEKFEDLYSAIILIIISAKHLNDLPLLYGIELFLVKYDLTRMYPLIRAVILNLEGRFEEVVAIFSEGFFDGTLDRFTSIEYVNSNYEANMVNPSLIHRIETKTIKDLYKNYLNSKSEESTTSKSLQNVKNWLKSWDKDLINKPQNHTNIIIPTCLNVASRAIKNIEGPNDALDLAQNLMKQELLIHSLFPSCLMDKNSKVYYVIANLLKGDGKFFSDTVKLWDKDSYFNHALYRNICDTELVDILSTSSSGKELESLQFKAFKHNRKCNNHLSADKIYGDLLMNGRCSKDIEIDLAISTSLKRNSIKGKLESLSQIIMSKDDRQTVIYNDLISKVVKQVLKLPVDIEFDAKLEDFKIDNHHSFKRDILKQEATVDWLKCLEETSNLKTKTDALILMSNHFSNQLEYQDESENNFFNGSFEMDLRVLECLSHMNESKYITASLECGSRILSNILQNNNQISDDNLEKFKSDKFIDSTSNIWMRLKVNVISIICNEDNFNLEWSYALTKLLKHMVSKNLFVFIYEIIVNRLNLKEKSTRLLGSFESTDEVSKTEIEKNEIKKDLVKCERNLKFWDELFNIIKDISCSQSASASALIETESFLKEIRKIGLLSAELFKILTSKLSKKLRNFLKFLNEADDAAAGHISDSKTLETLASKLKAIQKYGIEQINIIDKLYGSSQTKHDAWFRATFKTELKSLKNQLFNLILVELDLSDLKEKITSMSTLLLDCQITMMREYNHDLFMEVISPKLSRLGPTMIPMPDCCDSLNYKTSTPITIQRIMQTLKIIPSKTSPKKITFLGSDGLSRPFLLKSLEDLRLDQFVMNSFRTVNSILAGNRQTRLKNVIRCYSIVPVSEYSGLIQWVESPSICSISKTWLRNPKGIAVAKEIYSQTCGVLCDEKTRKTQPKICHENCQLPPNSPNSSHIFQQLLWYRAKLLGTNPELTKTKPNSSNFLSYRASFDESLFQEIVEIMSEKLPRNLISNHLWYYSSDSHTYWLKTKEFTNSCATMSIVGYIIGLGDRHPENILINCGSGEVMHIDYNACFESAKKFSVSERVPFRLTQNMIHAFGFMGLEGRFKLSCQDVLTVLRKYKVTLGHLFSPINLNFMIVQAASPASENLLPPTESAMDLLNITNRIEDKLSGFDEDCIETFKESRGKSNERARIVNKLTGQTVSEQVESLVMLATSASNKAAMFEGWNPWF